MKEMICGNMSMKLKKLFGVVLILIFALTFSISITNYIQAQKDESAKESPEPEVLEQPQVPAVSIQPTPTTAGGKGSLPPEKRTATLVFQQAKVELVLQSLLSQTGVNIVPRGKVPGIRVDVLFRNQSSSEIVEALAYKYKWVSRKIDEGHYELMDEETYNKEVLPGLAIQKIFKLKNITATQAEAALKGVLTKGIGAIAKDDRTNKIIVTDLPQVIEMIKRLLDQIDVKLITRVFYIRHAEIETIVDKLANYKSDPGIIDYDTKTHQIIVIDTFENIKRMELIIDVLDVGPEMRIYDINNIGFEGNLIEDLRALIERVVTEGAFWEINYRAGTLLVEDVPEVHEKIEKILLAFDRPSKQVFIQAEMIEAKFERSFKVGVDYDVSEDLVSAVKDGLVSTVPTGASATPGEPYGFIDLYKEFPIGSVLPGGAGLNVSYLNRHIRALFQSLMSDVDTKILIQPRIIVKNQETANIHVGGQVPYLTTIYTGANNVTSGYSSTTQAEKDKGTKLELKPSISNNGLIELKIKIENIDAYPVSRTTIVGSTAGVVELIETTIKEANTVLIVPSGETRVIGGLIDNQDVEGKSGVPYLVKIPVIGPLLFGQLKQEKAKRNIFFFITPTIVEEEGLKRKKYAFKTVEEEFPEKFEEELTTGTLRTDFETTGTEAIETLPEKNLLESSEEVPQELEKISLPEGYKKEESSYKLPITGPSGSFSPTVSPPAPSVPPTAALPTIPPPIQPPPGGLTRPSESLPGIPPEVTTKPPEGRPAIPTGVETKY